MDLYRYCIVLLYSWAIGANRDEKIEGILLLSDSLLGQAERRRRRMVEGNTSGTEAAFNDKGINSILVD